MATVTFIPAKINEKAVSEAQQQLFGVALAVKRGEQDLEDVPEEHREEIERIVNDLSEEKIKEFAETKHEGIPKRIDEEEKWAQDVDVDEGKMHRLLGVPGDQKIEDAYDDPKKLASDLWEATGDRSEASSMLAFAANVNSEENIFDKALQELEDMSESKATLANTPAFSNSRPAVTSDSNPRRYVQKAMDGDGAFDREEVLNLLGDEELDQEVAAILENYPTDELSFSSLVEIVRKASSRIGNQLPYHYAAEWVEDNLGDAEY